MSVNFCNNAVPLSYIKTHAADAIDYINDHKNPIFVTHHGKPKGVFIDIETYRDMIDALSMMKLLNISEKSIIDGKVHDNDKFISDLRKKWSK